MMEAESDLFNKSKGPCSRAVMERAQTKETPIGVVSTSRKLRLWSEPTPTIFIDGYFFANKLDVPNIRLQLL